MTVFTDPESRTAQMQKHVEKSENIQVEVSELEFLLLGSGDEDISITSLAENARDEGGFNRARYASRERWVKALR